MGNLTSKILLSCAYLAADMGLEIGLIKGLSCLFQKHEITEDYVINHPKIAFVRVMGRIFILIALPALICIAPISFVVDKIWEFCDEHFPDKSETLEVKDEWK